MSQLQVTKITTVDNTTPLILATGNPAGGQIIIQSSNTDVFFNGNLRITSLVTGDGSGLYLPSSNVANAAFNTANAAYASANNVAPQVTPAFNTANVAFDTANAAYASANNVAPQVTPAFNTANSAFNTANAAFASANNVAPQLAPAFNTANSAFATANIASNTAIAAYNGANAAYSQANAAYSHANTKFSSSGGSITGAVEISGDLTVRGNTRFIDQQTLAIGDSLIYLAANNYSSDVVDIGFVANYVNTGGSNVHTGLYRSSGNKEYYLFQGYDKEPYNNYIDPVGNNFTLAVLNADIITNNLFLGGANAINWIGSAFAKANASGANVGQTAPTGVTSGKLWWNSDLGKLFVYYTDPANTSSWIETSPSASAIEGSIITGYINPVFNTVNAAYTSSNSDYVVSNAAFSLANTALQNTNITIAGNVKISNTKSISVPIWYENETNVTASYELASGRNAMTAGPITINSGVVITVSAGSTWTVV
jgi:hypothetical protein